VRVGICQNSIVAGGRLRVLIGFIQVLNALEIKPDVLTSRSEIDWAQIDEKYGKKIDVNLLKVKQFTYPQDFAVPYFNWRLQQYGRNYDLLINTTNSLLFLPKQKQVLTYMFLPRKYWVSTDVWNRHLPEVRMRAFSKKWLYRRLLWLLYKLSIPQVGHQIISMTEFTKKALLEVYPQLSCAPIPVIYPPVDFKAFRFKSISRFEQVVTIGRFAPDKRQFEQIQFAEQCPDVPFHIVGFAQNQEYFDRCQRYIKEHDLSHIHLHPNLSFDKMVELLQNSRYFLHTLIGEEFGITAVQAIAAGCIPIVHNSGGQRETVPLEMLRYQQLEKDALEILSNLRAMATCEQEELVTSLQTYAFANFGQNTFVEEIKKLLKAYIE